MNYLSKAGCAILLVGITFTACKKAEESPAEAANEAPIESVHDTISVPLKNEDRKFIRTIDFKFKVKQVKTSSEKIEKITKQFGGFIVHSDLKSNTAAQSRVKMSQDSILQITQYQLSNQITLRIPSKNLDSLLNEMNKEYLFLDFKTNNAEDVSFALKGSENQINTLATYQKRMRSAIDKKGKSLPKIADAESELVDKEMNQNEIVTTRLSLLDQVNYSTVNIEIYENQSVTKEMIPNVQAVEEYRAGFGTQIYDSLKSGWFLLEDLILFLFRFWTILIIGFVVYIWYKKQKKINS